MKLTILESGSALKDDCFLELYRGSSVENAPNWYPQLSSEQALNKYEQSFLEYMHKEFWEEKGIQFLLEDDTGYRSGLRLYPGEDNRFFIEALETRPDSRRKGYSKTLLKEIIVELKKKYDSFTIYDDVYKTNIASINTHLSAGYTQSKDFFIEQDGSRNDKKVTFQYVVNPQND